MRCSVQPFKPVKASLRWRKASVSQKRAFERAEQSLESRQQLFEAALEDCSERCVVLETRSGG